MHSTQLLIVHGQLLSFNVEKSEHLVHRLVEGQVKQF